jgi:hypothetical protein
MSGRAEPWTVAAMSTSSTSGSTPANPSTRSRGLASRQVAVRVAGKVCVGLLLVLVGGLALLWWSFTGREDLASRRYARHLAAVELPSGYELRCEESGGTYFAAGNGPSASRSFSSLRSVSVASREVQQALEDAGYQVTPEQLAPDQSTFIFDGAEGVQLSASKSGEVVSAYVSAASVYDRPFGYADDEPGRTSVLLVIKDNGRSR